jgi:hypothetical protein
MNNKIINMDGICNTEVFIKVTGEDGNFYDLVLKTNAQTHIDNQRLEGYTAVKVKIKDVSPCIFRNFTCAGTSNSYYECKRKDGVDFYFK